MDNILKLTIEDIIGSQRAEIFRNAFSATLRRNRCLNWGADFGGPYDKSDFHLLEVESELWGYLAKGQGNPPECRVEFLQENPWIYQGFKAVVSVADAQAATASLTFSAFLHGEGYVRYPAWEYRDCLGRQCGQRYDEEYECETVE